MQELNLKNDIEKILVSEEQMDEITTRLAKQITEDYKSSPKKLVILTILKGWFVFSADLVRKISLPMEFEFMKVSSYGAGTVSSGNLNISLDISRKDLTDLDILIIEDIIDSGFTLSNLMAYLKEKGADSVKICTLLDKPSRRKIPLTPDYKGVEIPDEFVVGYGLDYDEKYRHLKFVGVLSPSVYNN
jgi:hypoxanthine phosphoribosyltransferase